MPRFAANLAYLFTELPLLERFGAAAAAGFKAVELQAPYDHPAADIRREIERHGLTILGINTPPAPGAETGLAAVPGRERDFAALFARALDYAAAIGEAEEASRTREFLRDSSPAAVAALNPAG